MRIAKKDIERLTYVEKALDTKENHLAKVIHNVLNELNPEFVYVVDEEGAWDGEQTHHTEVYASFGDAVNSFKNLARAAALDMREWVRDPSEIKEDEQIDEEAQVAKYEIYKEGYFTYYHDTISVIKKEVI